MKAREIERDREKRGGGGGVNRYYNLPMTELIEIKTVSS